MEDWRIEVLRLAAQKADNPSEVLALAKEFFAFIRGEHEASDAAKLAAVRDAIA